MQYAVGDMIVMNQVRDLGFINIAGVGQRMQDAVYIQGKVLAISLLGSGIFSPSNTLSAEGGTGRQFPFFPEIQFMFQCIQINVFQVCHGF
jgi:hypothetical protein